MILRTGRQPCFDRTCRFGHHQWPCPLWKANANAEAGPLIGSLFINMTFYGDLQGTSKGEMLSRRRRSKVRPGMLSLSV